MDKKKKRLRRAVRTRAKIKELKIPRLAVYRSLHHIYAQIIASDGKVLAVASTVDKVIKQEIKGSCGNVAAAVVVGRHIAERAVKAGIKKVAFDRSGFKYHGRIRALADAAREGGVEF